MFEATRQPEYLQYLRALLENRTTKNSVIQDGADGSGGF